MGMACLGRSRRMGGALMRPTMGRIVFFKVTDDHAKKINRRRTSGRSIADRIAKNDPEEMSSSWPIGAQAHIGTEVSGGCEYPMMITRVWQDETVSGQVFLDGNDVLWVQQAAEGIENGRWHWPERV
jgi:hypothetical protein